MNILFDIDGTLTNFNEIIRELFTKFLKASELVEIDTSKYSLPEKLKCSQGTVDRLFEQYSLEFVRSSFRSEASATIKALRKLGHKIFIVTARSDKDDNALPIDTYREETIKSLKDNHIEYDEFYFGVEDKAKLAQELGIDIAFEDASYQFKALSEVCLTYVVAEDYNADIDARFRLKNLYDAIEKVNEFEYERIMKIIGV